ncbi:MAG: hypothetical protein HYS87_01875 [Candidatus Colwellbacteria bacterium]|nr:hypothetical protein [Candidatus Colwellbacteria bacterium]
MTKKIWAVIIIVAVVILGVLILSQERTEAPTGPTEGPPTEGGPTSPPSVKGPTSPPPRDNN